MVLDPTLSDSVDDFQRLKKDYTLGEVRRRFGIFGDIMGGIDPRAAKEYSKTTSPYHRSRSEIDADITSLNELLSAELAVRKAQQSGDSKRLAAAQSQRDKMAEIALQGDYKIAEARVGPEYEAIAGEEQRVRDLHEEHVTLKYPNLSPALQTQLGATADAPWVDAQIGPFAAQMRTLVPAEALGYMEKYAEASGMSPEEFLQELEHRATDAGSYDDKTPLVEALSLYNQKKAAHEEYAEKYDLDKAAEDAQQKRRGIPVGVADPFKGASEAELQAMSAALSGGPQGAGASGLTADQQSLIDEVMGRGPIGRHPRPIKETREDIYETPEFVAHMEKLYGRTAQDRPFSDVEKRSALRVAQIERRKARRQEKQTGRQLAQGARRGEQVAASAQAAQPAAAVETETPVTEAPEEAAAVAPEAPGTIITVDGDDDWEYRLDGDEVTTRRVGDTEWVDYPQAGMKKFKASLKGGLFKTRGAPFPEDKAQMLGLDVADISHEAAPEAPSPEAPATPMTPREEVNKRIKAAVARRYKQDEADIGLKEVDQVFFDDPLGEGLEDILPVEHMGEAPLLEGEQGDLAAMESTRERYGKDAINPDEVLRYEELKRRNQATPKQPAAAEEAVSNVLAQARSDREEAALPTGGSPQTVADEAKLLPEVPTEEESEEALMGSTRGRSTGQLSRGIFAKDRGKAVTTRFNNNAP